jgi:hypothetical protein
MSTPDANDDRPPVEVIGVIEPRNEQRLVWVPGVSGWRWVAPGAAVVVVLVTLGTLLAADGDYSAPTIDEARTELLGYVGDVTKAHGYRYQATDDQGHSMDTVKIIQIAETGEFAAVYHWTNDQTQGFTTSLATSNDLLEWTWRVDLSGDGSQPTIKAASDGGYVVAWEVGVTDDIHIRLSYYPSWDGLLSGRAAKVFDAERQLPGCAEGTPNLYSASSTTVDFGLHFFRDCRTDTQARGTTDWVTWNAVEQPLLDRAAYLQGYRGHVGDRDLVEFRDHEFTFLEAQFTPDDWGTFRILVYDEGTGGADPPLLPRVRSRTTLGAREYPHPWRELLALEHDRLPSPAQRSARSRGQRLHPAGCRR